MVRILQESHTTHTFSHIHCYNYHFLPHTHEILVVDTAVGVTLEFFHLP